MASLLLSHKHEGRPADFLGCDGKVYNGRIESVRRRRFVKFVYYVWPIGEVTAWLDMRTDRNRLIEIY